MDSLKNFFYAVLAIAIAICLAMIILRVTFYISIIVTILMLAAGIFGIFKLIEVFKPKR